MASTDTAAVRGDVKRAATVTAGSALAFVLLVGTSSLFADMTYEGGRSIVGPFLQLLGSSAAWVGIAAGAGEFLGYAVRFVSGYWADRTHAYWKITIAGYAVQLFAMPALAFVGLWQIAILLWFVERIGKAVKNPPRDAMLSYATKALGRGWAYGLHEAMDQLGAFAGPLLMAAALAFRANGAGVDSIVDYQWAFRLLFIPAIICLAMLVVARVKFPSPHELESKTPKASVQGLDRRFWLYTIASGLIAAGYTDFALMAFHFHAVNIVADDLIPVLFSVAIGTDVIIALLGGRLFDRIGFPVLIATFGVSAVFAPFVFFGTLPLVIVGMILWGVGRAAQDSIIKAALVDLIPHDRRAYGFGVFSLAFGIFWFLGSAAMGVLYDQNVSLLVAFSVITSLMSLPVFVLAKRGIPATS